MQHASARMMTARAIGVIVLTTVPFQSACSRPEQQESKTIETRPTLSASVIPARPATAPVKTVSSIVPVKIVSSVVPVDEPSSESKASDPRSLLQAALRHCEEHVQDYRAVLTKQERVDGHLGKPQTIVVILRESPRRVLMTWTRNPARIRRALYVAGMRRNSAGDEMFEAEPAGPIARSLVGTVLTVVHDPKREAAGLGSIDQLGFCSMLRKIERISARADELALLDFSFAGESTVDGRSTIKLVREIQNPALVDIQASARLVVHLDREWRIPVSVQCYADRAGKTLLRSYVFTRVDMNPGIGDSSFAIDGSTPDMNALLAVDR